MIADAEIVACLPMVTAVAMKLKATHRAPLQMEPDELISAGAVGLLEARRRYRRGRGATFQTFASHRVRGAMLDYIRDTSPATRRVYARAQAGEHTGYYDVQLEHLRQPETLASVEPDALDAAHIGPVLMRALRSLDPRERVIIGEYFFRDRTMKEIAATVGVNESRISQLFARALRKLRAAVLLPGAAPIATTDMRSLSCRQGPRQPTPAAPAVETCTPASGWRQPAGETTMLRRKHLRGWPR